SKSSLARAGRIGTWSLFLFFSFELCPWNFAALAADPAETKPAKVVLLAGVASSKPGQHEYFAGCALLTDWLKKTPGVTPVLVRGGWPSNESVFDDAQCVVAFMDGGG